MGLRVFYLFSRILLSHNGGGSHNNIHYDTISFISLAMCQAWCHVLSLVVPKEPPAVPVGTGSILVLNGKQRFRKFYYFAGGHIARQGYSQDSSPNLSDSVDFLFVYISRDHAQPLLARAPVHVCVHICAHVCECSCAGTGRSTYICSGQGQ
jgi:hypothetical protein